MQMHNKNYESRAPKTTNNLERSEYEQGLNSLRQPRGLLPPLVYYQESDWSTEVAFTYGTDSASS